MATPDDDDRAAVGQIWIETTSYLLGRKELTHDTWTMVSVYLCNHMHSLAWCRFILLKISVVI